MPKIYWNNVTSEIYADYPSGRTRTIPLPDDIDTTELAYVLQSDTLRAVIDALDRGRQREC
ncbi:hypothetical protein [Sporosarcina aquimarina]|uniref:hypothetical protein n=1 Tax=Sporosarcina aquimarina TaxID=114975 RepID=UPI00295E3D1F|nr:hypothetical protein [Sporosarcina aquimarina]